MKKINILFTLIISLFFFSTQVKADAVLIDYTLTEEDFSYINEEFLHFRSKAIEYMRDNFPDKYYFISYNTTNNFYVLNVFKDINENTSFELERMTNRMRFYVSSGYVMYKLVDDNFITFSNSSIFSEYFFFQDKFRFVVYLDSNFDVYTNSNFDIWDSYTLYYHDKSFHYSPNIKAPTFYELYQYFEAGSYYNPHEEEENILFNFYITVIDSLKYVCSVFISNYIYLSMIVIIIFVLVIELLRRML